MSSDGHIFRRFDSEMRHLHALVVQMGELAVAQLQAAVATLDARDVAGARRVIADDKKLNDLDIAADDEIVRIIARRQPMAGDLREIIAVGKIVADLERAGDEARKIAGLTVHFYGGDGDAGDGDADGDVGDDDGASGGNGGADGASGGAPSARTLTDIHALAGAVAAMLTEVIAAFDGLDISRSLNVLQASLELDSQLSASLRRLTDTIVADAVSGQGADAAAHFVDIVLAIRALERFGGHAKNIAGHIVFIKHGIDVRHEGVGRILRELGRAGD